MTAFSRFHAVMAMCAAAMASAASGGQAISRGEALSRVGGYQGRGKGKTRTHNNGGTRLHQRAAMKKRNIARNRKAHR